MSECIPGEVDRQPSRMGNDGEVTCPRPRPGQPMAWLPGAILICAVTALQLPALASPYSGGYRDDGTYLVTAKAMAEGSGYVIESLPEQLAQTKYPALFPALLAVAWRVSPSFPENLALLRLVPLFAMWMWMWLIWKLVAVELARPAKALWIVGAMLASPTTLYFGTQLLSETLFAAASTWAILLMARVHSAHPRALSRPPLSWPLHARWRSIPERSA